jgi:hypothetical protein
VRLREVNLWGNHLCSRFGLRTADLIPHHLLVTSNMVMPLHAAQHPPLVDYWDDVRYHLSVDDQKVLEDILLTSRDKLLRHIDDLMRWWGGSIFSFVPSTYALCAVSATLARFVGSSLQKALLMAPIKMFRVTVILRRHCLPHRSDFFNSCVRWMILLYLLLVLTLRPRDEAGSEACSATLVSGRLELVNAPLQ